MFHYLRNEILNSHSKYFSSDKFALLNQGCFAENVFFFFFAIRGAALFCYRSRNRINKYENTRCIVSTIYAIVVSFCVFCHVYALRSLYVYVSLRSSTSSFMSRDSFYAFNSSKRITRIGSCTQKFAFLYIHPMFSSTYAHYSLDVKISPGSGQRNLELRDSFTSLCMNFVE